MLGDVAYVGLNVGQDLHIGVPINGGFFGRLVAVDGHPHLTDTAVCHKACPDKGRDVRFVLGDGIALLRLR